MEAISRSVRDAIITVDKESVLIELNEAAMTMSGYSPSDIGRPYHLRSFSAPLHESPGTESLSSDVTQEADSQGILEALGKPAWNKSRAARLLGIDRATLYLKMKRYNLTKDTP
jgi:transcriptional regulator with PAS, ATPase and Fis domain